MLRRNCTNPAIQDLTIRIPLRREHPNQLAVTHEQNHEEIAFERIVQANLACIEFSAQMATRVADSYSWIPGFKRRDKHRYLFAAQVFVVIARRQWSAPGDVLNGWPAHFRSVSSAADCKGPDFELILRRSGA